MGQKNPGLQFFFVPILMTFFFLHMYVSDDLKKKNSNIFLQNFYLPKIIETYAKKVWPLLRGVGGEGLESAYR